MHNKHLICVLMICTSHCPQVIKIAVGEEEPRDTQSTEGKDQQKGQSWERNRGNCAQAQFVLPGGFNLLCYFGGGGGGCVCASWLLLWRFLSRYLQVICMRVY